MERIDTCFAFNDQAEEAATFYTSVFPNSKIVRTTRYGKNQPMPEGTVLMVEFELDGRRSLALNGGAYFDGKFGEALSLMVTCDTQAEIDRYWDVLGEGGKHGPCGWLTDRYGVTWQIAPSNIGTLMIAGGEKSERVMQALMTMGKIDKGALERAYEGA